MKYLYHATLDENLAGIQKHGLKPVKDSGQCHWGGDMGNYCIGKAFLTDDFSFAIYYAAIPQKHQAEECLQMDPDSSGCIPEIILLRVRADKVKDAQKDRHTAADRYVERTIPASDIEYLHGDHCWKKLTSASLDTIGGITDGEWREPPTGEGSLREELDQRKQAMKNLVDMCSRSRR